MNNIVTEIKKPSKEMLALMRKLKARKESQLEKLRNMESCAVNVQIQ